MKEDAPAPKHPPHKRYQLQNAQRTPDLWLNVWANDMELPERERQLAAEERERRRQAKPSLVIGILADAEDATPAQLHFLRDKLGSLQPTEIHHAPATRRIAAACRHAGSPVTVHPSMREVVLNSAVILAAPRGPEDSGKRTPAWDAIHYAKHRKLAVTVVLPTGQLAA